MDNRIKEKSMKSIVKNIKLAPSGKQKIEWVKQNMPILAKIEEQFVKERPFEGITILVSVHVEAKTARLVKLLRDGGARVAVAGCNPLSTQDDVAAALATEEGILVYAAHGINEQEYNKYINLALDTKPNIIIDDGGDIVHMLHTSRTELISGVWGGCEETTTGVMRLKSLSSSGLLKFPMISVNDAYCKYLFDNRYGTGQSVWDGINRTTNLIAAGKSVVIAGYGWCGKGCAMRAKGQGANVIVCEIDPIKAIEAVMDGFKVMTMDEAATIGDIFITVTGCKQVIQKRHFNVMKNGVILANAGHFDVEISKKELEDMAITKVEARDNITGYILEDGRQLNLLAQGRLVNLAAGDGHPAEIMDMSFALQALSTYYMVKNSKFLSPGVYDVPKEIDRQVAGLKLNALCIEIDKLTPEQEKYLNQWDLND